jgi:hypothetical protein
MKVQVTRRFVRLAVLAVAVACVVAPVQAAVYTVSMTNGTSFDTRYEPEDAAWDSSKLVFIDEFGNVVAVAKTDVQEVTSDFEAKGYGRMINNTTMELGWAPNDALDTSTPEGQAAAAAAAALAASQPAPTTFDQFIEPNQTQGMPARWVGYPTNTPGATGFVPPPVQIPVPAPAPMPVDAPPPAGDTGGSGQ